MEPEENLNNLKEALASSLVALCQLSQDIKRLLDGQAYHDMRRLLHMHEHSEARVSMLLSMQNQQGFNRNLAAFIAEVDALVQQPKSTEVLHALQPLLEQLKTTLDKIQQLKNDYQFLP